MSIHERIIVPAAPVATPERVSPVVSARELTKAYPGKIALDGVDIDIFPGELTVIAGESGSGKTTLLQCMTGMDTVTSGSVRWGGQEITTLNDKVLSAWRAKNIGFVFQQPLLLPSKNAATNITVSHDVAGNKWDQWHMQAVCERLGILGKLAMKPGQMSGGEQQRVSIARALVHEPDVVFADEPTAALDSANKRLVHEMLRRCVDEGGATLVVVSHDSISPDYADRLITMADGRIAGDERRKPLPVAA